MTLTRDFSDSSNFGNVGLLWNRRSSGNRSRPWDRADAVVINNGVTDDLSHKTETKQMALMPLVSGAAEIHPTVATRPAWEKNEEDKRLRTL